VPDALEFTIDDVEIGQLVAVGTIPGVFVTYAAGANGKGTGYLASSGDGTRLAWKAPGSSCFGPDVQVGTDGSYLLEDELDRGKYVRVWVVTAFLQETPTQAEVYLDDIYNNGIGHDDVTAAEASAGDVVTYTLTMENKSAKVLWTPRFWLHSDTDNLEIGDDGVAWVSPTTESTALELPDLAAGGTDILHVRRTIAASSDCDPRVSNRIEYSFESF
jgi:hypothetical protein